MLDNSLGLHCKEVHKKPKLVKGQSTISFASASGSERSKQESQSISKPPPPVPDHDLHLPDAEIRPEKRTRTEFSEVASPAVNTSDTTPNSPSPSKVEEKLDLIITHLSNLDLKITASSHVSPSSKESTLTPASQHHTTFSEDLEERLRLCKTLSDICDSFDELSYIEQNKMVVCTPCVLYPLGTAHVPGNFEYDLINDEQYLSNQVMSQEFRNLKKHIKRHFMQEIHLNNVEKWEKEESKRCSRETRCHAIGMRIARICYAGYQSGMSARGYEKEILKAKLNGLDVGDINHSKEFYSNYRSFVADEVRNCLSSYFTSRLQPTGFLPPVNVQADKGTNCHRTRQFTSVTTVVPDSKDLITNVYLGQPVVKQHDGPGISQSIIDELGKWGISSTQIEGASFDGQYFHLSVPNHLAEKLGLGESFICTWDPLHKGGVIDSHIREDKSFEWLVEIQGVCKQIYTTFNWGKNYENFLQTCVDLDIEMKKLTNFQMTRFANSVRFVFLNIRVDYKAVRQSLSNVVNSKINSSNAKDRAKGEEAWCVLRKIDSWVFSLSLSGCADLYNVFGCLTNVCQKVNLLPFERFDQVQSVVKTVNKMYETIDHSNCSVDECKWERYHNDLHAMNTSNEYMNCAIGHVNIGTARQTRLQSDQNQLAVADGINLVKERLSTLAWRMHHDFCRELFDAETKQKIEHCRTICDVKSLLTKINRNGAVTVGLEEGECFLIATNAVTDTCKSFSREDMSRLFREYVSVLEEVFISSVSQFDASKLQNRKLIQYMIGSEGSNKFKEVRVVVHIILTACLKVSVESIVESLVSRYENHFTSSRQLTEEHALDEMIISENGPNLHEADSILERALNKYWSKNSVNGKWHFIRLGENIKSYLGGSSKVVAKMLAEPSKLPFMS